MAHPFEVACLSSYNGTMGAPSLRFLQGWVAILLVSCAARRSLDFRLYRQRRIPPFAKCAKGWGTHLSGMGDRDQEPGPPALR